MSPRKRELSGNTVLEENGIFKLFRATDIIFKSSGAEPEP
jgi:hypothetical protein